VVICISHLHSDHFLGLPGLLASFQLLGRKEKITIVGPEGIDLTVRNLIIANFIRVDYEIEIFQLLEKTDPITSFLGKGYTITAVSAIHEANALSYFWLEDSIQGKIISEKVEELNIPVGPVIGKLQAGESLTIDGREISPQDIIGPERRGRCLIYSGDTAINDNLYDEKLVCDILIHEATYPSDMAELAEERAHSTILQVATFAKKLQPKKLVMTHFSPRIKDFEAELLIAQQMFEKTLFAEKGMVIIIPYLYHNE
jgi:ribonuclease Z